MDRSRGIPVVGIGQVLVLPQGDRGNIANYLLLETNEITWSHGSSIQGSIPRGAQPVHDDLHLFEPRHLRRYITLPQARAL